jgi:hypothetical protein
MPQFFKTIFQKRPTHNTVRHPQQHLIKNFIKIFTMLFPILDGPLLRVLLRRAQKISKPGYYPKHLIKGAGGPPPWLAPVVNLFA